MPLMDSTTCTSIRNGNSIAFWKQQWIEAGLVLEDFLTSNLDDDERDAPVSQLILPSGEWNWELLNGKLPDEILPLIAGTDIPKADMGNDKTIWGLESDGRFRLKSAYKLAVEELYEVVGNNWKKLWKWKGPCRINTSFGWPSMRSCLQTKKEHA
ncbi:unnamed protein product [Linum trigynum]